MAIKSQQTSRREGCEIARFCLESVEMRLRLQLNVQLSETQTLHTSPLSDMAGS